MKARKGASGRPRDESKSIDTPVSDLGEKDTIMHYNAVILEDLKSKMDFVIEFMQTVKLDLEQKIGDLRAEMNLKFDALNYKIDKVEERLTLRIDKIAVRLDDHESRLATLESCH